MGIFSRKPEETLHRHTTEISDETREALAAIRGDLVAFVEVAQEIGAQLAEILRAVNGSVASVAVEEPGVQVFAAEPPVYEVTSTIPEADRIRDTPFTRRPRSEQVVWLTQVMSDGEWHSAVSVGKAYANDTRHLRYLKHAVGARLREMHEDGLVIRQASDRPDAMFEYKLR